MTASARADDWSGRDKAQHFAAGAAIGFAGMAIQGADNPDRFRNAFLAGAAVGLLKEVRDDMCRCGKVSMKDFVVTAVGSAAGAGVGIWIFPQEKGVSVGFMKAF
ncbi:MAG: hypothetical protein ACKVQK_00675 [Burkholderiales bacterium]